MAIAAPRVKLLRQLAKAKDDYMSGAFDIAWDGGSATIFMVFGQPSHAVFESGGTHLDGEAALDALLRALPVQFAVSDWRRAMSPGDTLALTIDDITEPLAELVGERADVPEETGTYSWLGGHDDSPDLGFDVQSFPLLPGGKPLWHEAPAETVAVADRLATIGTALIVLTGPRLRAAGVVRDGDLIDAVWVDSADHARGETAAIALLGAREGTVAGYALDGGDVAEALPLLWRLPHGDPIDSAWVDHQALIASLMDDREEHVLLVEGSERAAGFFSEGAVVAAYTASAPLPVRSTDRLLDAMSRPSTTLRVLQRRGPKPVRPNLSVPSIPEPEPMPTALQSETTPTPITAETPPAAEDLTRDPTTAPEIDAPPAPAPSDATASPLTFQTVDATPAPKGYNIVEKTAGGYNIVESIPAPGHGDVDTAPAPTGYDILEPAPAAPRNGGDTTSAAPGAEAWYASDAAGLDATTTAFEEATATSSASWVDFDDVRNELVAIAVAWLGDGAGPVTECVLATPSVVEDFITTLDTVRHMTLPGHDSASIYAMAREMHVHAAERLCGA